MFANIKVLENQHLLESFDFANDVENENYTVIKA